MFSSTLFFFNFCYLPDLASLSYSCGDCCGCCSLACSFVVCLLRFSYVHVCMCVCERESACVCVGVVIIPANLFICYSCISSIISENTHIHTYTQVQSHNNGNLLFSINLSLTFTHSIHLLSRWYLHSFFYSCSLFIAFKLTIQPAQPTNHTHTFTHTHTHTHTKPHKNILDTCLHFTLPDTCLHIANQKISDHHHHISLYYI